MTQKKTARTVFIWFLPAKSAREQAFERGVYEIAKLSFCTSIF